MDGTDKLFCWLKIMFMRVINWKLLMA